MTIGAIGPLNLASRPDVGRAVPRHGDAREAEVWGL